jgi:inorganic pyrophosphatase
MTKPPKKAYASPTVLQPFDADEKFVQVVIETPRGSRNKYKFEPKLGSMKLNKVLPAGMEFPYDFGFVPSTRAEDGDPLDVLLLMDEQAFPGCVVESRLVGVIEAEQEEEGEITRNDRLVAVAKESHSHSNLKDLTDLNRKLLEEVGQFFVNYQQLNGAKFKVLGYKGANEAMRLLTTAIKKAA